MPPWWPKIDPVVANAVAFEARKAVNARFAALVAPRQPRFDQRTRPSAQVRKRLRTVVPPGSYADTGDMYRLRAFVRVRHHEHCPPHTVWSEHSERFTIAAWYEGTGAPPVPVSLPDPTDGDFLKQLRPNVAFTVPGGLFNLLQNNDPKNLLSGRGSSGGPSQPGWVCGFNIPIITICAFVLLNIMLVLLHMLFWWLPFVKICFPIPSSLRPRP